MYNKIYICSQDVYTANIQKNQNQDIHLCGADGELS